MVAASHPKRMQHAAVPRPPPPHLSEQVCVCGHALVCCCVLRPEGGEEAPDHGLHVAPPVVCAPDALVALSINSVRLQHIMHTDSNSSSTAAQWKGRTVARYTTVLEDGAEVAPRGRPGT